jgi:hypothetical protein
MYAWMKKEVLFGKLLLCFLLFLIWCCLIPTAAIGANEEVAAEDHVTTVLVLPLADRLSLVEFCLKADPTGTKIKECEMLAGGYYAVISGDEFLVYAQPYDILTLNNMLEGLFDLGETSLYFETDISVITGLLAIRWENFEKSATPGRTITIRSDGSTDSPISDDVLGEVLPPETYTDETDTALPPPPPPPQDPFEPEVESFTTTTPRSPSATESTP